MQEFKKYRRTNIAEMAPITGVGNIPSNLSISAEDRANGSPQPGDMIARNPKNHNDIWLVAGEYFYDNFEPV